ncbi:MAG: hypothetical protein PWP23_2121 [Candidatus Sumerlaeota bacterium]|nr:hypothetical protein [Candidatus Sumerlaeota bacterium]
MEWYVPILVFFARILDVSLGTLRIVAVMRGHKMSAAALGFLEVTIWLLAVSAVVTNVQESWVTVIAYAGGFACGTLIGMAIEEKLAMGSQLLRIVNVNPKKRVARFLRHRQYRVTEVEGTGATGRAELSFVVLPRKQVARVISLVLRYCPSAYLTVEDIRSEMVGSTIFTQSPSGIPLWRRLIKFR